jgi:hypothetical protein
MYRASLHNREWRNLLYNDETLGYGQLDQYTPEGYEPLLLTPQEVADLVTYEFEGGCDDATHELVSLYYREEDVDRFLYYMSLLPTDFIRDRTLVDLETELKYRVPRVPLDLNNPVIRSYMQVYPESPVTISLQHGGKAGDLVLNDDDLGTYVLYGEDPEGLRRLLILYYRIPDVARFEHVMSLIPVHRAWMWDDTMYDLIQAVGFDPAHPIIRKWEEMNPVSYARLTSRS